MKRLLAACAALAFSGLTTVGAVRADDLPFEVHLTICNTLTAVSGYTVYLQRDGQILDSEASDSQGDIEFELSDIDPWEDFELLFPKEQADLECGNYWIVGCTYEGPEPGQGFQGQLVITVKYRVTDECGNTGPVVCSASADGTIVDVQINP
jgi:hypothetical protein